MVKFDRGRCMTQVMIDLVYHLKDFPDIPLQQVEAVFGVTRSAILAGTDEQGLSTSILNLGIEGLTDLRAGQISTTLWRKAEGRMCRMHQLRLCITEAEWRYSGVPCVANPLRPSRRERQIDAMHRSAHGRLYRIADGVLIDGQRMWPGEQWICHCWDRWRLPKRP